MNKMNMETIRIIVNNIERVLPRKDFLALHEPEINGNEWSYIKECLDTNWVSSAGKYVDKFERMLEEVTDAKHAIACVNGTAALHICLKLAGVESGDEVIIPALSFVATANAVVYCNAIPHFADSEEQTLGLDPIKLKDYLSSIGKLQGKECFNKHTGRRIKAVVPMHTFGHPVDMDPLIEVCKEFHLTIIEDAAESLGSFYKGVHTGNFGEMASLSFNGNKIVTTGGGGAILTNDSNLAKAAKHVTTTAKVPHKWEYIHDSIGFNYRMPNLNAALGCAQLERLPDFIKKKRKLANQYAEKLNNFQELVFFSEAPFAQSNYWLNVLLLTKGNEHLREGLLQETNSRGIMTRPAWKLLNKLVMFRENPSMDLSTAESLENRIVNLPSSAFLGRVK